MMGEPVTTKKKTDATTTSSDDLLTVEEAMDALKCSRGKIYLLSKEGRLELVKFDHATRVTRASINKLLGEIKSKPVVHR